MPAAARCPRLQQLTARLLIAAAASTSLVLFGAAPAEAAVPVPPTPRGLPAAIEAAQPYVGQSICDPVAKVGVSAFRDLVLRTYTGSTSLGIVRDCGAGGQSEHKEGRAWDWGVSASKPAQVAQVNALAAWLLATDAQGNTRAMARRLGIMYFIWNRRIFKMYDADKGWQAYTGPDPHTGHVHFSFGWSGAKKVTSYWDQTVAATDYGPQGGPKPTPQPTSTGSPKVTPVRSPANLAVLRTYGGVSLQQGSNGTAVRVLQTALKVVVDGDYGSRTTAAVARFETDQRLTADGAFAASEWRVLFPPPINPFGGLEAPTRVPAGIQLSGWTADADTTDPITASYTLNGRAFGSATASLARADVARLYPDLGAHGFSTVLSLAEGSHTLCVTGVNAPGSPGVNTALGCRVVTVSHLPSGAFETLTTSLGTVHLAGWALDPDSAGPLTVRINIDAAAPTTVTANGSRPDVGTLWPGYGGNHGFATNLTLADGVHTVCVHAVNATGSSGTDRAFGCRTLTVVHHPIGAIDYVRQEPSGVHLRGWALDPDSARSLSTVVTVDGSAKAPVTAAGNRTDLPVALARNGTPHGLDYTVALSEGVHTVCLLASNVPGTPGVGAALGCRLVTVRHSPVGVLQVVRLVPGGGLRLAGWALDPDRAASVTVSLVVDGRHFSNLAAVITRTDVAAARPGYGAAHGFSATVLLPAGPHQVCATVVNAIGTPGKAVALGCRSVLIATPAGRLEKIVPGKGRMTLTGWALDPDTAAAISVSAYVDGKLVTSTRAGLLRAGFNTAHPGYGDAHGYSLLITVHSGTHRVCSYGVNATGTPGGLGPLGCLTTRVS